MDGTTFSKEGDIIEFRIIQWQDHELVYQFVVENFFTDEPLCSTGPLGQMDNIARQDILDCIPYGLSIMAVKRNSANPTQNQLVGVNLAIPKTKEDVENGSKKVVKKCAENKWQQILKLLTYVKKEANVFDRYGVTTVLDSFMLCVHPSERGKSLGLRLKKELIATGKRQGYTVLTSDCSSFFAARACKQFGMELIFELPYSDYRNAENKPIFEPSSPHNSIKSYALLIK